MPHMAAPSAQPEADRQLNWRRKTGYTDLMKKPSWSANLGLWIAGGLVALYFLGGVALWAESIYFYGRYSRMLPIVVQEALYVAYDPFFSALSWILTKSERVTPY